MRRICMLLAALFVMMSVSAAFAEDEVKVTWLGHSALKIDVGDTVILVDPFLTGNSQAAVKADDLKKVDYIFLTHGHDDHLGDTVSIAKRTGATVVSNFEIVTWLDAQGLKKVHPLHIGGGYLFPFGYVKMTPALHGSSIRGEYGGNPGGFLFEVGGKKIYHAGDTGLTKDMELLKADKIDLAFLPVGDNFTMGPRDAARAAGFIEAKTVVPMHYNTFDMIKIDVNDFVKEVEKVMGKKGHVTIMKSGDKVTL